MPYFLLILSILLWTNHLWAADTFVLPGAVRLEGVGGVYGLVAGADKVIAQRTKIVAGGSLGQVKAAGAMISDIPVGVANFGVSFLYANVQEARFQTSYSRELSQAHQFGQEISAEIYGGGIQWRLFDESLKLNAGILYSTVNLEDFFLNDVRIQRPNTSGYFPIETISRVLSAEWNQADADLNEGFKLGLAVATAEGRTGQSDLAVTTTSASVYVPIAQSFTLAMHARASDSFVIRKESRYLNESDVKNALATNCGSLASVEERSHCQLLEDSISTYVAKSNSSGTAAPIGGSNGVRSYDELSLRAAHTRLFATELRWQLKEIGPVKIGVAPFCDFGWSAENGSLDKAVMAYGAALRVLYKSMPIRVATAHSENQSAWFITAGQSF